ncbi:MAG: hypothetical protein COB46_06020 [Rhodospirillaceae bacterium]|nr:MAG: hypothetical protein COB46_06020 [Rhodospirillaceae bacterium]
MIDRLGKIMFVHMKLGIFFGVAIVALSGCSAGARKASPTAQFDFNISNLDRQEYEVLASVEGSSKTTSYLFGAFQIHDDKNISVLGIPFFEERYAFRDGKKCYLFNLICSSNIYDRAYYKALAATPNADAILKKGFTSEERGVPGLFNTETVSFTGKAVRIKDDTELGLSSASNSINTNGIFFAKPITRNIAVAQQPTVNTYQYPVRNLRQPSRAAGPVQKSLSDILGE